MAQVHSYLENGALSGRWLQETFGRESNVRPNDSTFGLGRAWWVRQGWVTVRSSPCGTAALFTFTFRRAFLWWRTTQHPRDGIGR